MVINNIKGGQENILPDAAGLFYALRSMGGKIAIYKRMNHPDTAISICEEVCNQLSKYGYRKYSTAYRSSVLKELINKGDIEKAAKYIIWTWFNHCFFIDGTRCTYYNETKWRV